MSLATSIAINDRMELAGPPDGYQMAEAVFALERHGFEILEGGNTQGLPVVFDPPVSNSDKNSV
jgi:hypothetical protein